MTAKLGIWSGSTVFASKQEFLQLEITPFKWPMSCQIWTDLSPLSVNELIIYNNSCALCLNFESTACLKSLVTKLECGSDRVSVNIFEPWHDKTNKMSVRPAKTQISLGICPVWSVFPVRMKKAWVLSYTLSAQRTDQTGRMPRLIRVFGGRTLILLVLSCCGSFMLVSVVWLPNTLDNWLILTHVILVSTAPIHDAQHLNLTPENNGSYLCLCGWQTPWITDSSLLMSFWSQWHLSMMHNIWTLHLRITDHTYACVVGKHLGWGQNVSVDKRLIYPHVGLVSTSTYPCCSTSKPCTWR